MYTNVLRIFRRDGTRTVLNGCVIFNAVKNMDSNENVEPIIEVGEKNFELEVLQAKQPVLVFFVVPWSRPCQTAASVMAEVTTKCPEMVKVVKINADNNPDLGLWYEIQSVPTLLFFVNGALRAKIIGTTTKEAILSKLESLSHRDS